MPLHRLLNAYLAWLHSMVIQSEHGAKEWAKFKASINRPPPEAMGDPETRRKYARLRAAEAR